MVYPLSVVKQTGLFQDVRPCGVPLGDIRVHEGHLTGGRAPFVMSAPPEQTRDPGNTSGRVELRELEPLTPSLRTRGTAVDQACQRTDLGVRRQGSPVEFNGSAVLSCCTSRPCELSARTCRVRDTGASPEGPSLMHRRYRPFMHPSFAPSPRPLAQPPRF